MAGLRKDVSRSEKIDVGTSLPAGRCKFDGTLALAKEAIPWSKAVFQRQFWVLAPVSQKLLARGIPWNLGDPCRNFHSGAFRLRCWDLGPCPDGPKMVQVHTAYSSIVHPCGAEAPGIKVKDASKEVAKSAWLKLINVI